MRKFGLELEFLGRNRLSLSSAQQVILTTLHALGDYTSVENEEEVDWDQFDPSSSWMVKYDSSCDLEVTTPAMLWSDFPVLAEVARALYRAGARTNRSCGLHVHHEANDYTGAQLQKLWYLWYLYENTLFSLLPSSRQNNNFCEHLSGWEQSANQWSPMFSPSNVLSMDQDQFRDVVQDYGRYHSLNMTGWWQHGRVEVRAHHGTLNPRDIKLWTLLTQRLVGKAKTLSTERLNNLQQTISDGNALSSLVSLVARPRDEQNNINWFDNLAELISRRNPQLVGQ